MASGLTDAFGQPLWPRAIPSAGEPLPGEETSVPAGPALGDPATRSALARYRRRGVWIALAAVVVLAGFFVGRGVGDRHSQWLLEHGGRTDGVITGVSQGVGGGGVLRVEYVVAGRLRHGTIVLTESSDFYRPYEAVTVVYDPAHPADIRTPGEANEPRLAETLLMLALLTGLSMLAGGAVTLERARRRRRLLAASPWRPYRARYLPRVTRARIQPLTPGLEVVPVDAPSTEPALLRLASTWRWRGDGIAAHDGETVWLAGNPAGRVLIAIPATRQLIGAGAPRAGLARSYERAASESRRREPAQVKKERRVLIAGLALQWALFSGLAVARTGGGPLGIAVAALDTVVLLSVAVVLRRAWRRQDGGSPGAA